LLEQRLALRKDVALKTQKTVDDVLHACSKASSSDAGAEAARAPARRAYYPDIEPVWYRAFASLRVGAERSRADAVAMIPLDFWGRTENERAARSMSIGTRRRFPGSPYGHSPAPEKSCSIAGVPAGSSERRCLPAFSCLSRSCRVGRRCRFT
jgi:hypothetical protein